MAGVSLNKICFYQFVTEEQWYFTPHMSYLAVLLQRATDDTENCSVFFLIERRTIHFWNFFNIFVIKLAFLITLSKQISPTEPLHIFPCLQKLFLKEEFQRQFLIKAWRYRYQSDVLKLNQIRWCTKFFNRCNQSPTLQIFTTLSLVGILWHHTQFTSKHWVSVRHGKYDFFFKVFLELWNA